MFTFKLKAVQTFRDVEDHRTLHTPGSVVSTQKVERVNDLIKRGLAVLVSCEAAKVEAPAPETPAADANGAVKAEADPKKVQFNGAEYDPQVIKEALISAGVAVAPNAGVKGLTSKIEALTEEQKTALAEKLTAND